MKINADTQIIDSERRYFSLPVILAICILFTLCTSWSDVRITIKSGVIDSSFYISTGSSFVFCLLFTLGTDSLSKQLDVNFKWNEKFYKRLYYQLLFGWLLPFLFFLLLNWGFVYCYRKNIQNTVHAELTIILVLCITFIINGMYMGAYFSWYSKQTVKKRKQNPVPLNENITEPVSKIYRAHFTVPDGKNTIDIACKDVAFLFRDGRNLYLITHDEKSYVFWNSLDVIEDELDPYLFLRVSRSYILSLKSVSKYDELAGGGILLTLNQNIQVKVSRHKAQQVKEWISNKDSLNK